MPRRNANSKRKARRPPRRARTRAMPLNKSQPSRATAARLASTGTDIRVRHKEYLALVSGTNTFQCQRFTLNPSNTTTFPWLAPIANQYQHFRINNLRFEFDTACATTQSGVVGGVMDYNVHDAPPTNYQEAANAMGYAETPAYKTMSFSLDKKTAMLKDRYLVGPVQEGADATLYAPAVFNLVVPANNSAGTGVFYGRLHVSYDITLMTPQQSTGLADSATTFEFPTTGTSSNVWGSATTTALAGTLATIKSGILQFTRAGDYLVSLASSGTGMDASSTFTPILTGSGGIAQYLDWVYQSGVRAAQTFLVVGAIAGTSLHFQKTGLASATHADVMVSAFDAYTNSANLATRQREAAARRQLVAEVTRAIMLEDPETKEPAMQ